MRRTLLALTLLPGLLAALPRPDPAEERDLRAAGISPDGPDLLDYLKKRGTSGVTRDQILALIAQLGDESFSRRQSASAGLVAFGSAAVPFLESARKERDLEVVRRAEDCLEQIAREANVALPSTVVRAVARLRPPGTVAALLTYLPAATTDATHEEVHDALTALAVRDGKADPDLLKALEDSSPLKRAAAAEALARADLAGHLPAVRKVLRDPDPVVRFRAAHALATAGEKDAVPELIELIGVLPPGPAYQADYLLCLLAGDPLPAVGLGNDEAGRRACRDAWKEWWAGNQGQADLGRVKDRPRLRGNTLLVLLDQNRVLEVDEENRTRWQVDNVLFPLDAQWLPGDHVLVAEQEGNRVTERNRRGEIVWKLDVPRPLSAQRLPNGNTFVANQAQLLEVTRDGKEVFSHARHNGDYIMRAQRLPNGDIACVVSSGAQRYLRLDPQGKELYSFPVVVNTSGGRVDVLPNGNVLLPQRSNNLVVEYDKEGKQVKEIRVAEPIAAVRLANGHTLLTTGFSFPTPTRAVELDRSGKEVWEYKLSTRVTRAFRR